MAMSRSLGGDVVDDPVADRARLPCEIASRPATMRSAVVLPHPDGPTRTMNSLSAMSRSRRAHGLGAVRVHLPDIVEHDLAMCPLPRPISGAVARRAVARSSTAPPARAASSRDIGCAARSSPAERRQQQLGAEPPALEERLAHGGEPGVRRDLDVVEADDATGRRGTSSPAARGRRQHAEWPARRTTANTAVGGAAEGEQLLGEPLAPRAIVRAVADQLARPGRCPPSTSASR